MSTSQEAPALIQYACERCKTRFVLPPSTRKLGPIGKGRAALRAVGTARRNRTGLGEGYRDAGREIIAKLDDRAYQSFVQSFRFCHECRQFVCNDCWSPSRRTCLTCVSKAMSGTTRPKGPVPPPPIPRRDEVFGSMPKQEASTRLPEPRRQTGSVASKPGPVAGAEPRRAVTAAPIARKRRLRHDVALLAAAIAIVAISLCGGYALVIATGGVSRATPAATAADTPTPTPVPVPTIAGSPTPAVVATPGPSSGSVAQSSPTPPPKPAILCNGQSEWLTVKADESIYCGWTNEWAGAKTTTWLLNGSPVPPPYKLAYDGPGTVYSIQLRVGRMGVEVYSNDVTVTVTAA